MDMVNGVTLNSVPVARLRNSVNIPDKPGFYFARRRDMKHWDLLAVVTGEPPFLAVQTISFRSRNEILPGYDPLKQTYGFEFGPLLTVPPPVQPTE